MIIDHTLHSLAAGVDVDKTPYFSSQCLISPVMADCVLTQSAQSLSWGHLSARHSRHSLDTDSLLLSRISLCFMTPLMSFTTRELKISCNAFSYQILGPEARTSWSQNWNTDRIHACLFEGPVWVLKLSDHSQTDKHRFNRVIRRTEDHEHCITLLALLAPRAPNQSKDSSL